MNTFIFCKQLSIFLDSRTGKTEKWNSAVSASWQAMCRACSSCCAKLAATHVPVLAAADVPVLAAAAVLCLQQLMCPFLQQLICPCLLYTFMVLWNRIPVNIAKQILAQTNRIEQIAFFETKILQNTFVFAKVLKHPTQYEAIIIKKSITPRTEILKPFFMMPIIIFKLQ